ncbi:hypothetical protein BRYFOR_06727 [Marvinbryantia formatexigens DSM 14469]|uniref:Uncharacterized protein n=1 Tax=Marvinbryantia formatexigens DSM 14469 TaxID=478749 RepID=C6LDM9_9FIRM|nr:hypothetical protein BRYFOR_06727 [Marvinbryantia formatexigens DSM 14469]
MFIIKKSRKVSSGRAEGTQAAERTQAAAGGKGKWQEVKKEKDASGKLSP